MKWFERLGALILGGVFLYAGAVKMRDPLAFADSIASFKILSMILINPLALSLPPLEILTGLILIRTVSCKRLAVSRTCEMVRGGQPNGNCSPFTAHCSLALRRLGVFSVVVLCSVFLIALLSAPLRGIQADCGCFTLSQGDLTSIGSGKPSILKTWLALGRDILLLAAAIIIYRRGITRESTQMTMSESP